MTARRKSITSTTAMPGQNRQCGSKKTATGPRAIARVKRYAQALDLRGAGWTFAEIATEMGYKNADTARSIVNDALRRTLEEPSRKARRLHLFRLHKMLKAVWPFAIGGQKKKIKVKMGKKEEEREITTLPDLEFFDRALKALKEIADCKGFNAPKRVRVGGDKNAPAIKVEAQSNDIPWDLVPLELRKQLLEVIHDIEKQQAAQTLEGHAKQLPQPGNEATVQVFDPKNPMKEFTDGREHEEVSG